MVHKKTCVYCGKRYESSRSDSKTCSSTCRVRYNLVKDEMTFIGNIQATDDNGKCMYYREDVNALLVGKDVCRTYLKYDPKKEVIAVYAVKCCPGKRYCEKCINLSRSTNSNKRESSKELKIK